MKTTKMVVRKQYENGPSFKAERLTLQQVLWIDANDNLTQGLFDASADEVKEAIVFARKSGMWMQDQQENDVHGGMIAIQVWKF